MNIIINTNNFLSFQYQIFLNQNNIDKCNIFWSIQSFNIEYINNNDIIWKELLSEMKNINVWNINIILIFKCVCVNFIYVCL